MDITVLFGDYPVVFLLVLFRVMALLFMLPFFGIMQQSKWLVFAASFPVTLLFCTVLPPEFRASAAQLRTAGDVVFALLGESLLGAAVGVVCGIFIAVFNAAGLFAERGTSLMMAKDLDPVSGEQAGILARVLNLFFIVFFLTLDAHLVLVRLVAKSFASIGVPWTGWMECGLDLARLGAYIFEAGLSLALPVMVVSLLTSIAMALMARLAQEFNVLFLSLPFRVVSGMLVLGVTMLLSGAFFRGVASDMLSSVAQFLKLS